MDISSQHVKIINVKDKFKFHKFRNLNIRCYYYIEWINNKILLCSTGNYIQYPEIMEKNIKKIHIYV